MAAAADNKKRLESALQRLKATVEEFKRLALANKTLTEAEQKALLVETFGADRADAIFADWQRRGKAATGTKASREPVSKALRDSLLAEVRRYNPKIKEKDFDYLLAQQGAETIAFAIQSTKQTRAKGQQKAQSLPVQAGEAQIGYKSSNEDFWQPLVEPVISPDKDGWYKAGEFALGMKQQRERDAANAKLEKELKAALGFTRDPFTGLEVPPKPQEKAVEMETHAFWRTTYPKQKAAAEPETKTHPFWRTKVRK